SAHYWLDLAGFGVAGFDPTIPLIALAWLLLGVPRRTITAFVATAMLGTWAYGVVLALTVGHLGIVTTAAHHLQAGPTRAVLEGATLVAGAGWLVVRWRRGPQLLADEKPRTTVTGAVLLALALVLWWVADPGFIGGVVVAGRGHGLMTIVLGLGLWVLCAQWPLALVAAGLVIGAPDRPARAFEAWWDRTAPYRFAALNALIVLSLLAVVADALGYASGGRYLVLNRHHH
ncbi:MAG: hypothetical protein JWP74_1927, partial [Marmoricola sp.]|nr:hypothetical protein [Marmoricola sp.]